MSDRRRSARYMRDKNQKTRPCAGVLTYNHDMLSEAFLRQLRTLTLNVPRRRIGTTTGERRSMKRGRSVEFADYRNYTPGDDPRRVDWNVYARSEKPVIKLYEDEEDVAVHMLLDQSASMHWQPDSSDGPSKAERSADIALALLYVALAAGDKVSVYTSNGRQFGPKRGLSAFAEAAAFLERTRSEMHTQTLPLNSWLKAYALRARPGLCIVFSDLFDDAGYNDGFNALGARGIDVNVLHVLAPDEIDPHLTGDMRLKDVETEAEQDLSIDDIVLNQYRARLKAWSDEIESHCQRRGGRYFRVDVALPLEQLVLRDLRGGGWLH
jgi:uncharacterized protein (DUF58 family)